MADKLAEGVMTAAKVARFTRLRDVSAAELESVHMAHPFRAIEGGNGEWDYDVPMLPGDHVTLYGARPPEMTSLAAPSAALGALTLPDWLQTSCRALEGCCSTKPAVPKQPLTSVAVKA